MASATGAPSSAATSVCSSDWYTPLDPDLVRQQLESFQQLESQLQKEWEDESLKYEQLMTVTVQQGGKSIEKNVPRRNYANPEGKIQDPSLYPYDNALYPLLDAYDALYLDDESTVDGGGGGSPQKQPISDHSKPPCTVPIGRRHYTGLLDENMYEDEDEIPVVESHTPVSVQCLGQTLLQTRIHCCSTETLVHMMQRALDENQEFFNKPLVNLKSQAALQGDNAFYAAAAQEELLEANEVLWISDDCGHERLPFARSHRGGILLKVLKHALSELQRDDRLAAAVSILLARHHDLDDTSLLARFLAVLSSEHIACDGECEWEDAQMATHYCMERQNLDAFIPQILAFGITVLKAEHANVLAGFVRYAYHREFGHMMVDELEANADVNEKRNRLLKRTAFARRMEGEDDDVEGSSKVPVDLISSIIHALGVRGSLERHRLMAVTEDGNASTEAISLVLDTYINCLRALVDIAEACLLYLPVVDRFFTIASAVVKNLASLLIDSEEPLVKPVAEDDFDVDAAEHNQYFGSRDPILAATRMSVPTRLSDCVSNANDLLRHLNQPENAETASPRERLFCKIRNVCRGRPPNDVRDAVRGLFLRELVNVREAFLGYTDFLVWCRFPYDVTPLDPVVCAYGTNFPCEEDDSDDDSDDDDDESDDESSASGEACVMNWCTDEDEHILTRGEIRARYDFSLMLLLRAWNAPWNPNSNLSYQPEFRQAAKSVMLCTHRLAMPKDVGLRIVEFLARDFWPDERTQCWSFECSETTKNILKHVDGERDVTTSIKSPVACPTCRVAVYCCEACRKTDWKEDHKRFCNVPPFRICADEQRFMATMLGEASDTVRSSLVKMEVSNGGTNSSGPMDVEEDNVGEEEEWSDIDSEMGEEEEQTRTKQIYKYFEERTYSPRGIDD